MIIYFYLCFQTFLGIEYLPPIRKILYVYTWVYVYLTQIFRKKGLRFGISENWCRNKNQYLRDNLCASVQPKQSTFTFLAQIYPKMELGLEIQKTNIEIRINFLKIACLPIFKQDGQLWLFRSKFSQNEFWSRNFNNLCPDLESAPPRYHVCKFSVKTDNFELFGLNLGKLSNYVLYCWF